MIPYNGDARTFVTFRGVAPAGLRTATGGSFARSGLPTAVLASSYDVANQQLTFGPATQTFDANGNLLTQTDATGTTTYTWDARNRLTALTGPTVSATFAYDALGRRTTKTINGQSTSVLYDGLDIVKEDGEAGDASYLRTLGIDEALSRTDASGTLTYLPDALGNTLALADISGAASTTYTYAPFGETSVSGLPSSSPFQFTGRENDGTGLYYYRARYYNPGRSRFVSEDPIGLAGGINPYTYAANNPMRFTDPKGTLPIIQQICQHYLNKCLETSRECRKKYREGALQNPPSSCPTSQDGPNRDDLIPPELREYDTGGILMKCFFGNEYCTKMLGWCTFGGGMGSWGPRMPHPH